MKRINLILAIVVAMTLVIATGVSADPCPTKKDEASPGCAKTCGKAASKGCAEMTKKEHVKMQECCLDAVIAKEACCGKTAEEVKELFDSCPQVKEVKAEMHPCCAEAVGEGKGCCGKDAECLKADFLKGVEKAMKNKDDV